MHIKLRTIATIANGIRKWKQNSPTVAIITKLDRRELWADQLQIRSRNRNNQDNSFEVASTLDELVRNKEHNDRFQPLAQHEREKYGQSSHQVRAAIEERRQLEAETARSPNAAPTQDLRNPLRGKLPRTPIVSQPREHLHKDHVPPKAIDAPKHDHKIQPKSRRPNKVGNQGKQDSDSPKLNSKQDDSAKKPSGS